MVPDKPGYWYHKTGALVEVRGGISEGLMFYTKSGRCWLPVDDTRPADWLGPVPTAEEWATAQARMARMEGAIELAVERFEDEADKWREGIDDEDGFNKDLMNRYAADLRKALEP
jgi:hypothetical protein